MRPDLSSARPARPNPAACAAFPRLYPCLAYCGKAAEKLGAKGRVSRQGVYGISSGLLRHPRSLPTAYKRPASFWGTPGFRRNARTPHRQRASARLRPHPKRPGRPRKKAGRKTWTKLGQELKRDARVSCAYCAPMAARRRPRERPAAPAPDRRAAPPRAPHVEA
jgi:hypothetical protein